MSRSCGLASSRSTIARTVALTFGVLAAATCESDAQQWSSFGGDLLLSHQLSEIVISAPEAAEAHVFVDPVRNVSNDEGQQLRTLILESLDKRVRIADKKEGANYWLQIILQEHKYAITNANHEPAHGSLTFSICKYPIKAVERDCENFVYFYFFDSTKTVLFKRVLPMWMEEVFATK
jgi:hypothetical protein